VDKRTVTIGVNINLGNYENLRVEVTDIAGDEAAVRNLAEFLGRALDGFGMNNAATKAAIDKYKERVLDTYAPEKTQEPEYQPMIIPIPEPENTPAEETGDAGKDDIEEEEIGEGVIDEEEIEEEEKPVTHVPAPAPVPIPAPVQIPAKPQTIYPPAPKMAAKPPAPRPEPAVKPAVKPAPSPDGEYTCEKCGASISKVQRDVSNLFMGKTLCKNCMK